MVPVRLRRVTGHEGRANDALFQPAARAPPVSQHTLVFFGGDVQDFPEVMEAHRENRNYMKWNLENMVRMLGQCFPTKHILVVRPSRSRYIGGSRVEFKSFSCYDNFVPSNNAGVPEHTPTHGALLHLERLLQSVSNRIKSFSTTEMIEAFSPVTLPEDIDIEDLHNSAIHPAEPSKSNGTKAAASGLHEPEGDRDYREPPEHKPEWDPLWWREKFALDESQLTLVGFSKGCVVLNQLIYEFHYVKTLTPGDAHMMRIMSRIVDMYWLDGGHAGGKNTWITSRSLLETLTRLNINIFVHVSPYQVQDESRPWIGKEEKAFTSLLKKNGAKVKRYLHNQPGMPHSLNMHFEVLAHFKSMQDCIPSGMPNTSDEDGE